MVSVTLHGAPSQHQCHHMTNGPLCTRTVQSELLTFLIKDTHYGSSRQQWRDSAAFAARSSVVFARQKHSWHYQLDTLEPRRRGPKEKVHTTHSSCSVGFVRNENSGASK
jgi:hypothetical protein